MAESLKAARIESEGDLLRLRLDPLPGHTVEQTLTFPADQRGMTLILAILRQREQMVNKMSMTIGTAAAPVQYDIDEMLKKMGKTVTVVPPAFRTEAPAELKLEDIGL